MKPPLVAVGMAYGITATKAAVYNVIVEGVSYATTKAA